MKNLFKNLMLVAVAAMAFVACSQEGIEVNNLTKKTIVEGIASINTDDTRSGFVGSETVENEDGSTTTVYKSAWDGGENIKVFATEQGLETTAIINADGKFTAEFDGELPANYYIAVCSPAEAWESAYTCNIPTVQTPRTDSVDPAAHILTQQGIYVSNGSADPFLMQHQVGYGKMTVNTPAEFVIDYVEVELNGDWYDYPKTLNYTINADNVEGNVFWFATDVVEVSDFTVTAYDAEGNAYTKSVTIPEGRELKFQYGRVSTFSVSNLEKYVAPAFTSENSMFYDNISWNYVDEVINYRDILMIFSSEELGTLQLNFYNAFEGFFITPGTFSAGDLIYIDSGTQYSYYKPAGSETAYQLNGGSVIVSVTEDKKYHFEFKDITYNVTNTLNATYVGDIEGFGYPDLRTQLDTPSNLNYTIEGNIVTITWDAVENAGSYLVDTDSVDVTTKDTYATFELEGYGYYYFYVKALASEADSDTYKDSNYDYIIVAYEDPRPMLELSNVSATASGNTVTISWDDVEGAGSYTVTFNGNTQDTTNTEVIFIELEYNTEYNYSVVANPANEETHRASYAYNSYVKTERDPNAPSTSDIEVTEYSASIGGNYTDAIFSYNDESNRKIGISISFNKAASNGLIPAGTYSLSNYLLESAYCYWGYGLSSSEKDPFSTLEVIVSVNNDLNTFVVTGTTNTGRNISFTYTGKL